MTWPGLRMHTVGSEYLPTKGARPLNRPAAEVSNQRPKVGDKSEGKGHQGELDGEHPTRLIHEDEKFRYPL